MRPSIYKQLMECLDNAMMNGYDEILEAEPDDILNEIEDQTGIDFNEVDEQELRQAIWDWQKRTEGRTFS